MIHTCSTHANLIHDITYTKCRAQNGSTHGLFLHFSNINFYETVKSTEKCAVFKQKKICIEKCMMLFAWDFL